MRRSTIVIILVILFKSCSPPQPPPPFPHERVQNFIFGKDCNIHSKLPMTRFFKVKNDYVIMAPRGHGFWPDNGLCYKCDTLRDDFFKRAIDLKRSLPYYLLVAKDSVFGMPDSLGHCGYYLQFDLDGRKRTFHIEDYEQDVPEEIDSLRKKMEWAVGEML